MMSEATNNPTHLTKVEIRGLWGRYDIDWNLNSDVNVLAGGNGSGKSTIIKYLYNLIDNNPAIIKEGLIKKIFLNFSEKTTVYYEYWYEFEYKASKEPFEEKVSKKDKVDQEPLKNLDIHIKRNGNYYIRKYQKGDLGNIYNSSYGIDFNKAINIDYIATFDTKLKPQELLKKVDDNTKTELDFQLWNLQKRYLNYQIDIGKRLRANRTNPNDNLTYSHDKFIEIIDTLFSETDKKINQDENEIAFLLGGKEINAYQLSSGEKQLLVIFLTVLIQDNKPSILFMDEPEISLHIEWQRKLITYIRELNPNVQLIIATHSPDIIVHGWMDKVFNVSDLIVKDNKAA